VDINHEDNYNDTALDYLLYSPNYEMQTLLIENGATGGFLVASFTFINQMDPGSGIRDSCGQAVFEPTANADKYNCCVQEG
jgi:ankyrin repeat protein